MPSNQYNSNYTGLNHDTYVTKEQLIDLVYPVGSYYMSESSTNPTALFGGSWEQIKDRFILAAGDSYAGGATGGSSSHSHTTNTGTTGGPSNNTSGSTTLVLSQIPSHGGHLLQGSWSGTGSYYFDTAKGLGNFTSGAYGWQVEAGNEIRPYRRAEGGGGGHTHTLNSHTHSQTSVGTSGVSNMPPYLVAYIWKRIA